MTVYRRGDVVLVGFIFSDETGVKQRPAVIISSDTYNQNRQEAVIIAVTSNIGRTLPGNYRIRKWRESGLLYPSVATGIIRTIKQTMIIHKLGVMSKEDLQGIEKELRATLGVV